MEQKAEPRIVERAGFVVAGTRYAGRNEHGEIPQMWDAEFLPRLEEITRRVGTELYGVAREWVGGEPGAFEYLAGAQVPSLADVPTGMVGWEIPDSTYAVLPANDVPDLGRVNDYLYGDWIPRSRAFQPAHNYMLEVYPERYPEDHVIQVCFPIQKRVIS